MDAASKRVAKDLNSWVRGFAIEGLAERTAEIIDGTESMQDARRQDIAIFALQAHDTLEIAIVEATDKRFTGMFSSTDEGVLVEDRDSDYYAKQPFFPVYIKRFLAETPPSTHSPMQALLRGLEISCMGRGNDPVNVAMKPITDFIKTLIAGEVYTNGKIKKFIEDSIVPNLKRALELAKSSTPANTETPFVIEPLSATGSVVEFPLVFDAAATDQGGATPSPDAPGEGQLLVPALDVSTETPQGPLPAQNDSVQAVPRHHMHTVFPVPDKPDNQVVPPAPDPTDGKGVDSDIMDSHPGLKALAITAAVEEDRRNELIDNFALERLGLEQELAGVKTERDSLKQTCSDLTQQGMEQAKALLKSELELENTKTELTAAFEAVQKEHASEIDRLKGLLAEKSAQYTDAHAKLIALAEINDGLEAELEELHQELAGSPQTATPPTAHVLTETIEALARQNKELLAMISKLTKTYSEHT